MALLCTHALTPTVIGIIIIALANSSVLCCDHEIYSSYCSKKSTIDCPKCGEEISLNDCFKDKAAENELKTAIIKCTNQNCPWEGPSKFYTVCLFYLHESFNY